MKTSAISRFMVERRDERSAARTGVLTTEHGVIHTPVFMPVGTQGTVKTLTGAELQEAGAEIVLGNTYHLFLRPGEEIMRHAGGLHRFIAWDRPILTDSGGFQIFSLATLAKIQAGGVEFRSHIDGSKRFLSPEDVVRLQEEVFGSDILMPLDECVRYPAEREYTERSVSLTTEWARRSKAAWGGRGLLFGIVQGGVHADLRKRSAEEITAIGFPGYAIGGLSVGEPTELLYQTLAVTAPLLPEASPRYLMGVGLPGDLLEAVSRGVDMFDCVVPTRNGRNGTVFTRRGRLNLRGAAYARDLGPIEEGCRCFACRTHTRAYLRHLFNAEEHLAGRLASLHNVTFFIQLLRSARRAIEEGCFAEFRADFEKQFATRESS